jgi:hypothetical protein
MQHLLHAGLFDCDEERYCRIVITDEFRSFGIAPTDVGNDHGCSRNRRSARASLPRFILRADMRCSLSPFRHTESLTAKYLLLIRMRRRFRADD